MSGLFKIFPFFFPLVVVFSLIQFSCVPPFVKEVAEPHPMAEEGFLESAIFIGERIDEQKVRSPIYAAISKEYIARGDIDNALYFARKPSLKGDLAEALYPVVLARAKSGDLEGALNLTDEIEIEYYRSGALAAVAELFEERGEYRRGREIAENIEDPKFSAEAFSGIALIYHSKGYGDLAVRLFSQAYSAAASEHSLPRRVGILLYVADKYNAAGLRRDAESLIKESVKITGQLRNARQFVHAYSYIIRSFDLMDDPEEIILMAHKAADHMEEDDAFFRDQLYGLIAEAYLYIEKNEDSIESAGRIEDPGVAVEAFGRSGVLLAARDNDREGEIFLQRAAIEAERIESPSMRERVLADLARYFSEIGMFEDSVRHSYKIEDRYNRSLTMVHITDRMLTKRMSDEGVELIADLLEEIWRLGEHQHAAKVLVKIAAATREHEPHIWDTFTTELSRILWRFN